MSLTRCLGTTLADDEQLVCEEGQTHVGTESWEKYSSEFAYSLVMGNDGAPLIEFNWRLVRSIQHRDLHVSTFVWTDSRKIRI